MSAPFIAVLDYGIGNLRSAEKALQRVGADARLTSDADVARRAGGLVLPGVGAFGRCAEALRDSGLEDVVGEAIDGGRPFLGICIGLQLLYEQSEEDPDAKGIGVRPGMVRRLPDGVKVPQMQWNRLRLERPTPLFDGIDDRARFYFVHSYAPDDDDPARVVGTCDYGGTVVAAVELAPRQWAVQFHPEKSGAAGLRLLANFAAACQ